MSAVTRPTHSNTSLEVCRSKRRFSSRRTAKMAARHLSAPSDVYECPFPNPDGSTHWHISRRSKRLKQNGQES